MLAIAALFGQRPQIVKGQTPQGYIVPWGNNVYGQTNVPLPNTGFIAVAAARAYSLGLKTDGSIIGWGLIDSGQTSVPGPNSGFIAVAAGGDHCLGLKSNAPS